MSDPFANRKLQLWLKEVSPTRFANTISLDGKTVHTPTLSFNRVFILHHIYRHFFYEGIGLCLLMYFYYVFKQGFDEKERAEAFRVYEMLRLTRFFSAVIYVLHKIFGLENRFHLLPPDEELGKVLLAEILEGGNFGQTAHHAHPDETFIQRGARIIKRNMRFLSYAWSEVVWQPYFNFMNRLFYTHWQN